MYKYVRIGYNITELMDIYYYLHALFFANLSGPFLKGFIAIKCVFN